MVEGDRLDIRLDLAGQAEALVSTPSAAKWYRARSGAVQSVQARVAPGAHLEWLPLETIVFDGAHAKQSLRVELGAGATWTGWDITRLGRSARGEAITQGSWQSVTEVWRADGLPLWIDRQRLTGGAPIMRSRYGLSGSAVIGTLAWVGSAVTPELVESARACWTQGGYGGEAGVTRLTEGLLCRYRGASTAEARAWFTAVWDLLRRYARGRAACPPRVWKT
jgi:urease accessory protein